MKFATRIWLFASLLACIVHASPVHSQDYPTRAIKIVVPFGAGGSTDSVIRILGSQMEKELKTTIVVENRGGGSATIGTGLVAQAQPDGYTLGAANIAFGANPSMLKTLPYNTQTDFTPVSLVARVPLVLAVHPSIEAKSVAEFIALAKAKPDTITFGTVGHGSGSELSMSLLAYLTGLKLVKVPFPGGGQQVSATVGGHVASLFATIPPSLGHFESGKLRPLGISTVTRDATLPNVPTIAEAGVPNYEMGDWVGIVAPAKTPPAIVERLNQAIAKALADPEVKARLEKIGTQVAGSTPAEFHAFIQSEVAKWSKVVDTMGLRVN